MSINLFALAWQISFPGKPAKKLVLLSLADSTNAAHDYTWPSYDTIAERCGISRRAVINAANELEAEGIVTRVARYKPGSRLRTSNAFRLNLPVLQRLANANARVLYAKEDKPVAAKPVSSNGEYDSPRSEYDALNGEHIAPTSEHSSPPVVNTVHPYGEHSSPKPEDEPEDRTGKETGERESGAIAPARPPGAAFLPVSEALKAQKARRGITEPGPDMPPALKLLNELTTYWPGDANAPLILAQLGDNPDRSTLGRAVELWRASGNKPTNWLGICDWYQELQRDPDWTPQKRFKTRPNGKTAETKPTTPVVLKEIAPGLY